jgi:four helix bundle protein
MANIAMIPSSEVRSFRDLTVWQEAMDLAVKVHKLAELLPEKHQYEIGRQLRRASTSIPSNVAEGFNRHSRKAYRAHVAIALGSAAELETVLELALRLSLLAKDVVDELIDHGSTVARLAQGLWRSLRSKSRK